MKARTPIDAALLRRQFGPVITAWERQARRIDALSLRERAILFGCIVIVGVALADSLVMSPLTARARVRSEAQAQQAQELKQLREQFVAASRENGAPTDALRTQLDAARAERARLDDALRTAGSVNEGEGLARVLQRLLARQPGLVLERLRLLDDAPVTAAPSPATASAAGAPGTAPAAPLMAGMSWQGVELQVQGSYADLQRHVQMIERELPGLRWGELRLSGGDESTPPRLQAQLFLLKVQP